MSDSEIGSDKTNKIQAQLARLAVVKEWLGILSLSRMLRWAFYIFVFLWLYTNWQEDRSVGQLMAKYAFPDSKFVEIDGMNVHVRTSGNPKNEALLLLHGTGGSLQTWTRWTEKLTDKYQVVSVDLPGHGLTGQHPRGSYSLFMYASFLEKLADSLGLRQFNLVGNGMGGQIAWFFAAEHPEKLKKLVLLDPRGFEKKTTEWVDVLARTPVLNSTILKITPRTFFRWQLEANFSDDALVSDSLVNRQFELFLFPGNRRAFIDRAQVSDNHPPVEFIEKITCPTLILWGAEDAIISPEFAYEFHKQIRKSELKIYENTGHWPQEESPDESVEDVRAFLEGRF